MSESQAFERAGYGSSSIARGFLFFFSREDTFLLAFGRMFLSVPSSLFLFLARSSPSLVVRLGRHWNSALRRHVPLAAFVRLGGVFAGAAKSCCLVFVLSPLSRDRRKAPFSYTNEPGVFVGVESLCELGRRIHFGDDIPC